MMEKKKKKKALVPEKRKSGQRCLWVLGNAEPVPCPTAAREWSQLAWIQQCSSATRREKQRCAKILCYHAIHPPLGELMGSRWERVNVADGRDAAEVALESSSPCCDAAAQRSVYIGTPRAQCPTLRRVL